MCVLWEAISEWIGPEAFKDVLQFTGLVVGIAAIVVLTILASRCGTRMRQRLERDPEGLRRQREISDKLGRLR
jgi:hypothetical protein